MSAFLSEILQVPLYLLYIVAAFFCGACLAVVIMIRGTAFMENYRDTFTESAGTNLTDMFVFINPQQLFIYNMVAVFAVPLFVWLVTGDKIATVASVFFILIAPSIIYANLRKARLKRLERQLPDGLLMIAGAMRAGASLSLALEGAVREQQPPLSQEFELFMREQRLGVEFGESLTRMGKRVPLPDFQIFIASLRINREIGGNLVETLEVLAETLRRKITMEGKIESLTAQGKMQGIVMSALPLMLAGVLMFIEPEAMGKLFTTQVGWIVLGVIVVMESLGFMMIRKITAIDV